MRAIGFATLVTLSGAAAMPAPAAVFTYVVSGVVDEGISVNDGAYFGSLVGQKFTATFSLNDRNPGSVYSYGATGSSAAGGDQFLTSTQSPLSAVLQIGATTVPIPRGDFHQPPSFDPVTGDPYGEAIDEADLGQASKDGVSKSLMLSAAYSYSDTHVMVPYSAYSTNDLAVRFTLQSAAFGGADFRQTGTFSLGPASYGDFDSSSSGGYHEDQYSSYSFISLVPDKLTVKASAVPEPASWALMTMGLGVVGGRARSRRSSQVSRS